MTNRKLIASNSPWESIAGFSRAVRVGNPVCISGTTASDAQGQTVCAGDPAGQARDILQKVERALNAAGASLGDVIRTRVYVTQYAHWEAVARIHGEVFKDVQPANTLVVVRSLVPADALVEIEADAIISLGLP